MKTVLKIFVFFIVSFKSHSQNLIQDIKLVIEKEEISTINFNYYKRFGNNQSVFETKSKFPLNPVVTLLKGAMLMYQNVISPQLSKECPYEITCSNFSKHLIKEYGLIKGVFLSADRITRCNRIAILDVNYLEIDPSNGSIKDNLSKYKLND
jgi:uncharacterized protein